MQTNRIVLFLIIFSLLCLVLPTPSPASVMQLQNASGVVVDVDAVNPVPISGTITVGAATNTTSLSAGIIGSATLSFNITTPVALPVAPTKATKLFIFPTQDLNWGNASVVTGTADQYFFQSIPGQGLFGFSSFTGFRFIGRTAIGTATLLWY